MGLLRDRISEVRHMADWLTIDEDPDWPGSRTTSGVTVTRGSALGLTTIWRCWDLLSSSVAQAPKQVVLKIGGRRFPEFRNVPDWLSRPNPTDPNYTANDYFAQVALSLLADGNFFTHVFPNVFEPVVLTVLDPGRVRVIDGPRYELLDEYGKVYQTVGPFEMLHGVWIRLPGARRGISPLETLRRGIGSAIAAEDFASRFFGKGAALSFGVEVPTAMDPEKKKQFRESLRAEYAGLRKSHAIGVLTDGAKFVTGLQPTPDQAQMLETRKFSVEDLCRPHGVPPGLVGSQEPGASSYASASVYDMQFKERGVLPLAVRIETPHNRLLEVPDDVTDPSASMQFKFNLDGVARVDLKTRAEAEEIWVRSGQMTPDEARALEDRAPLPGGDRLYMQSQMVPLTEAGTQPEPVALASEAA